jgi:tRNA G18 (ribose-2'-O)-methylase SpoU
VHSVLNTLRVAAAVSQQRQQQLQQQQQQPLAPSSLRSFPREDDLSEKTSTHAGRRLANTPAPLHPHRRRLSCLYVRDFSAEEEDNARPAKHVSAAAHTVGGGPAREKMKRRKEIPARYTAVRCIAALAKSLDVPVRFVPRSELVQLCGERRNQNVVLEASSYTPHAIQRLEDVWAIDSSSDDHHHQMQQDPRPTCEDQDDNTDGFPVSSTASSAAPRHTELILFLEHIIDPTNVGSILRTAFFFGVDHVILSRDCAACTAAVSRTSTGFLEHLHVHRVTTSTADFLRTARETRVSHSSAAASRSGSGRLEVIASAVVSREPVQATAGNAPSDLSAHPSAATPLVLPTARGRVGCSDAASLHDKTGTRTGGDHSAAKVAAGNASAMTADERRQLDVRLLLLGNEDAGLSPELLRWCTHVAHVRSPRQQRLRQARQGGSSSEIHATVRSTPTFMGCEHASASPTKKDDDDHDGSECEVSDPSSSISHHPHHAVSAMEKRAHSLQRLARLREKEVSLNVNTATAALLATLVAVEGELPTDVALGMVEVHACKL